MENPPIALDAPKKLRIGKLEFGVNLFVQILLWLFVVGMINYWSLRHFWRFDWGYNRDLELSPQTRALVENLGKPAQAIVFFSGQFPEAERDAVALLKEYEYASKGKLTMEIVDPDANRARALELSSKYKFGAADSIVIFDYDGRNKFVNSSEMAEMEPQDPMENMQRRMQGMPPLPPPRMLAFKGEQVMTSALLEITEAKANKLYFISGHGEVDYNATRHPASRILTEFKQGLSRQNFQHAELKLAEVDRIPDDANGVIILGPTLDYSERDARILGDFWDRKGRFLICTGPTVGRTPNLNKWLAERGVTPQGDDVIRVDRHPLINQLTLVRAGAFTPGSPITKGLEESGIESEFPIQSLALDRTKETSAQLRITELMTAPKGFWGEKTPMSSGNVPRFDPGTDNKEPLTLAAQVEKGGSPDPKVKLDSARLVIFGTSEILTDRGLQVAPQAQDVAITGLNYLLSRESLISLPPKKKERQSYSFKPEQISIIGWWVMAYIPLAIAIFGLYHLWWRHRLNLLVLTAWLAAAFLLLVGSWYLVTYLVGDTTAAGPEAGSKGMPTGLIVALSVAVVIGGAAMAIHLAEQKKRLAAQK